MFRSHIVHFGPEPLKCTSISTLVKSLVRVIAVVLGFLATYLAQCLSIFVDNMPFSTPVTFAICRRALP